MSSSADIDAAVLDALRSMDEVDLHKSIIHPLLQAMGAHHIRYVHGAFERGKDFLYLAPSFFETTELCVCQVKNERLTGSASSPSTSTTGFLYQAQQCKDTEVLHPATNCKQTPDRVVLITTYALPDAALADANTLMAKVRAQCTVIGPEELLGAIQKHIPMTYSSLAFPGNSAAFALQRYISEHREADAFELSTRRDLDAFYINIGVSCNDSIIGHVLAGTLRATASKTTPISEDRFIALWTTQKRITEAVGGEQWLAVANARVKPETIMSRRPSLDGRVTVKSIHPSKIRTSLQLFLKAKAQASQSKNDAVEQGALLASTLETIKIADDFLSELATLFDWTAQTDTDSTTTVMREISPGTFIADGDNICIEGQAGAGKTCLARMITQHALEQGLRCIYFPCTAIRQASQPLEQAIVEFLSTLSPEIQKKDLQSLLNETKLLIIDGCDESPSFSTRLAADLEALTLPKEVAVQITTEQLEQLVIPNDLREVVYRRTTASGRSKLVAGSSLSNFEMTRLLAIHANGPVEPVITRLLAELRERRRKVVATVRNESAMDLPESFARFVLSAFDDKQLKQFFESWCNAANLPSDPALAFLDQNKYIRDICRVPINATIVAAAFENGYDLPHSRVEVYERRFDLLLDRWDRIRRVKGRNTVSKSDKLRFLSRLALALHSRRTRTFDTNLAGEVWENGFQRLYVDYTIEDVLAELLQVNSVIARHGREEFSLGHLSYQEYLTAHAIALGQHVEMLINELDNPWWQQVAIFYAGISGDLTRFAAKLQQRGGLRDPRGVLNLMMDEARYTGKLVRTVIGDMLSDRMVDDGWAEDLYLEFGDDDKKDQNSDVGEGRYEEDFDAELSDLGGESLPSSLGELWRTEGSHWGREIRIDGIGSGELIVETSTDIVSTEQQQRIAAVAAIKDLGQQCLEKLATRRRSLALAWFKVEMDEEFEESEVDMIEEIVKPNIELISVIIPEDVDSEFDFAVYVMLPWYEDSVMLGWRGGKIITVSDKM